MINDTIVGNKFGKWTIIEELPKNNKKRWVKCICTCGKENKVNYSLLKIGGSTQCKSCRSKHHGLAGTSIYNIWSSMKSRCLNKGNPAYRWYGARGIKICDNWLEFENFYKDMGDHPHGMQLDRIDGNGNYEPSNCRWVTLQDNLKNIKKRSITNSDRHAVMVNKDTHILLKALAEDNYCSINQVVSYILNDFVKKNKALIIIMLLINTNLIFARPLNYGLLLLMNTFASRRITKQDILNNKQIRYDKKLKDWIIQIKIDLKFGSNEFKDKNIKLFNSLLASKGLKYEELIKDSK